MRILALVMLMALLIPAAAGAAEGRFEFGSYGRVGVMGDQDGGAPSDHAVVSHGPRLEQHPYVEIHLNYHLTFDDVWATVAFAAAYDGDPFHYTGGFASDLAVRNMYLEAGGLLGGRLSLWVGSRMYRGDDIYLFDYWPLDNLNTIGGGLGVSLGDYRIDLHGGVNRLRDERQTQTISYPDPYGFGTVEALILNRQRFIGSLAASGSYPDIAGPLDLRLKLYGEWHYLPNGEYFLEPYETVRELPRDHGWLAGLELSFSGFLEQSFANLFVRYGQGLAAFGEMTLPYGTDPDWSSKGAKELVLGLSSAFRHGIFGGHAAWYSRLFLDATGSTPGADTWEHAAAIRPELYYAKHLGQAVELSLQLKSPRALDPNTGRRRLPAAVKASLIPFVWFAPGPYERPQIRAVYTCTWLNRDARAQYHPEDIRHGRAWYHYFGVQAEWWFNWSYR